MRWISVNTRGGVVSDGVVSCGGLTRSVFTLTGLKVPRRAAD
jgi:hypothetical protein